MELNIIEDEIKEREVLGFLTNSRDTAMRSTSDGFKVSRRGDHWLCEAPSIVLYDLSNVSLPYRHSKLYPLRLWTFLEANAGNLLESISRRVGTDVKMIRGASRQCELRIASAKAELLEDIRTEILLVGQQKVGDSGQLDESPGVEENFPLVQCNKLVLELHEAAKNKYSAYIDSRFVQQFKLYNCTFVAKHQVWKRVHTLGESFVFNLHDGVPYALGFSEVNIDSNVYFIEYHSTEDPYADFRPRPVDIIKLFEMNEIDCGVVLDRSLTGKTLQTLKEITGAKTSIGMFPKSLKAARSCDFVIFSGTLIPSSDVPNNNDWYIELFKKIASTTN